MPDSYLQTAIAAARVAGAEALRLYRRGVKAEVKGQRDIVTEGDRAAQEAAVAVIRARFPEHAIVAEEDPAYQTGQAEAWPVADGPVWFVDPVDGTSNYARQIPFFNVSIGFAIDGHPVAGVIYDPLHDEEFAAERGAGAMLNGQAIQARGELSLANAMVGFDVARGAALRARMLAYLGAIAAECRTVRGLGSAALGLAYVAAGKLDAYVHMTVSPWDVAAGALIVREAGGVVRQFNGDAWNLAQSSILVCNPALLDSLLGLTRDI